MLLEPVLEGACAHASSGGPCRVSYVFNGLGFGRLQQHLSSLVTEDQQNVIDPENYFQALWDVLLL